MFFSKNLRTLCPRKRSRDHILRSSSSMTRSVYSVRWNLLSPWLSISLDPFCFIILCQKIVASLKSCFPLIYRIGPRGARHQLSLSGCLYHIRTVYQGKVSECKYRLDFVRHQTLSSITSRSIGRNPVDFYWNNYLRAEIMTM